MATLDDLRDLLKDFNSFLDFPVAFNCDKMYEAYPDAKFILVCLTCLPAMFLMRKRLLIDQKSTRDPEKWAKSMKATLIPLVNGFKELPDPSPFMIPLNEWYAVELESKTVCPLFLGKFRKTFFFFCI